MQTPTKTTPRKQEKENTPPSSLKIKSISFHSVDSPTQPNISFKKIDSVKLMKSPHKLSSLWSPRRMTIQQSPRESPMKEVEVPKSPRPKTTNFDSCIKIEEIKNLFVKYCKENNVGEQVNFVLSVQKYKFYTSPMLRYKEARRIVHQHVKVGSPEEINIGYGDREESLSYFQRATENDCPDDIFDEIYVEVKMMMLETWKMFIKTDEFIVEWNK